MTKSLLLLMVAMSQVYPIPATNCVWPDYFDLSSRAFPDKKGRGSKIDADIQTAWQTDTRLDENDAAINGIIVNRRVINVLNQTTIEITNARKGNYRLYTATYNCSKMFGNDIMLIEKVKTWNLSDYEHKFTTPSYRCLQLRKHSLHVLQWILGPESEKEPNCEEPFGDYSEWPLVYWPITFSISRKQVDQNADLFEEYSSCPLAGGYLMHVYHGDGTELQGCQNDNPSSRFEMECVKGEGLHLIPGKPSKACKPFTFNENIGSQLYCLGSWTDPTYRYTVMVPARQLSINSFHCLRTRKDDPTKEHAILFLDNICKSSQPNTKTESFLQLGLRRKSVAAICDDYSDQCDRTQIDCNNPTQSTTCFKSCQKCPTVEATETNSDIRGNWIIQKVKDQETITIGANTIHIPVLGTFDVRAKDNQTVCHGHSWGYLETPYSVKYKKNDVYMLSRLADGEGCIPRVLTFALEEITSGVGILYHSGTAPLRNQKDALDPVNWCKINQADYHMANFYHPYWPAQHSVYSPSDGWYTVVNPDKQKMAANCRLDSLVFTLEYKVTFDSGNTKSRCTGRIVAGENETSFKFTYGECSNSKASGGYSFTCLASRRLDWDYTVAVMQAGDDQATDAPQDIQPRGYYCLMVPKSEHMLHKIDPYPLLITPAGMCDHHFKQRVSDGSNIGQPLVRLITNSSGVGIFSNPASFAFIISVGMVYIRHN